MSDNEIRQILIEKKRLERKKQQDRELIRELAENIIGWGSLFIICFMLTVIGG